LPLQIRTGWPHQIYRELRFACRQELRV
jgi:hypothetical protein